MSWDGFSGSESSTSPWKLEDIRLLPTKAGCKELKAQTEIESNNIRILFGAESWRNVCRLMALSYCLWDLIGSTYLKLQCLGINKSIEFSGMIFKILATPVILNEAPYPPTQNEQSSNLFHQSWKIECLMNYFAYSLRVSIKIFTIFSLIHLM